MFYLLLVLTLVCPYLATGTEVEWKEFKRQHFIIYYRNAPLDFVKTVEAHADNEYSEITRNLGFMRSKSWTWEDRAKIYIYDDQDHYVQASTGPNWSSGHANTRAKIIRTFPSASGFFDTTLPHELAHIIFREAVGRDAQVPLWFEEGVAMYQEKARRWGAHDDVRDALEEGSFMPVEELDRFVPYRGLAAKLINLFYAESASVVNYMINEMGPSRFVRFCRKLKEAKRFEWTLKSVYVRFSSMEELNAKWVRFLEKK